MAQVDATVLKDLLSTLKLVQGQMNLTENQFKDALTILQESAENRTTYILHQGKMVGDKTSLKKYEDAQKQQMSNHFLYGGMSAVQRETEWWEHVIDLVGLTFSKQSVLNKWSYQKMQTATEKSVYQMSFSTLLLKSNNLAEQADEIALQVNNLLAGVLNPEKTYLTAGILSVSEIQEILKLYPEVCLTLKEFFMPNKVPVSTAMPQGGNKLLIADIYISKCNKTQLGTENVNLSQAENLNQAKKIESIERQMLAFNETLSEFQNYAKVADTVKSHSSLWTAGIIALVIVVAFFGGVTVTIFIKQYTLKKRADVQEIKQEIRKKAIAEEPLIAETEGL